MANEKTLFSDIRGKEKNIFPKYLQNSGMDLSTLTKKISSEKIFVTSKIFCFFPSTKFLPDNVQE